MRQILLVGGAGFIGTAVATEFGESSVTIFDNFSAVSHSDRTIKKAVSSPVEIVVGDVSNPGDVGGLFGSGMPEDIVYLAAETGTGRSLGNCTLNAHVNTVGLATMLDAISAGGVMPRSIVLASTRAVYGEGPYMNSTTGQVVYPDQRTNKQLSSRNFEFSGLDPLNMDGDKHRPNPCNIYGATKLSQEHMLRVWSAAHGVNCSVVRFQNVYGPGQSLTNPYTGILIHFIKQVVSGVPIEVYENGGITRDFVHVTDAAKLLVRCIGRTEGLGLYDCGSGNRTSLEDVAKYLSEIGRSCSPEKVDKYRLGDVRHACADISSAASDLDWSPQIDLKDGLEGLYVSVNEQLIK